jgi:hypothetical protein
MWDTGQANVQESPRPMKAAVYTGIGADCFMS